MERYTNYCTEDETRRAFKLGAPIIEATMGFHNVKLDENTYGQRPTTQQVIGWMRKEKDIDIPVISRDESEYFYIIETDGIIGPFNEYEDAEHMAIDITLNQLEEKHDSEI